MWVQHSAALQGETHMLFALRFSMLEIIES
jgi:hypothetical protein